MVCNLVSARMILAACYFLSGESPFHRLFWRWPLARIVFTLTIFVSAFMLFLVQPLIGKLILPKLGGTPQVWNTCMLFFQSGPPLGLRLHELRHDAPQAAATS